MNSITAAIPADRMPGFVDDVRKLADYADFNYGARSPITKACAAGDVDAFLEATKHVTEQTDVRIVMLQNRMICAGVRA